MNDTIRLARNNPRHRPSTTPKPQIDIRRMRAWRLGRIQSELHRLDLGGIILYDPVNIRYATGSSNMQVWFTHNPIRYCFVPAQGKAVLFDYEKSMHLYRHLETIGRDQTGSGLHLHGGVREHRGTGQGLGPGHRFRDARPRGRPAHRRRPARLRGAPMRCRRWATRLPAAHA